MTESLQDLVNRDPDFTGRYTRQGNIITDLVTGDQIDMSKLNPAVTEESAAKILQELNEDFADLAPDVDPDEPGDCDCGECLTCVILELAGEPIPPPADQDNPEFDFMQPDEEEFEDDSEDWDLGGES